MGQIRSKKKAIKHRGIRIVVSTKNPNFIDVTACVVQVTIYRGQRNPRLRAFDIDITLSNRLLFDSVLFEDSHACNSACVWR